MPDEVAPGDGTDPDGADDVAPDGSPVAVYLRLAPGTTPALIDSAVPRRSGILELGCGVGRITRSLVALGHVVVAVDNSAAMLQHVKGARRIQADVETLDLGEHFDVVLLASHFINAADPVERRALWTTCARHARPGGYVLIERYEPGWARNLSDETREVDGVKIVMHDVTHDGDRFHASATYEVDGRSWTQRFTAQVLEDELLVAEAERAGLAFDSWLDADRRWVRFVRLEG